MRKHLLLLLSAAAAGLVAMSAPGIAQQKTVKTCVEEWRANRAANQAAGITQRAYVERCRTGATAQTTTPIPAPATTIGTTAGATAAPKKTVRACAEEWRANRAANQAAGITQRAYVERCRTGATAQTMPPLIPAPATATGTTAGATGAPKKTVRACVEEWRANRAANQAAGITQRAYVENCRAGVATAQPQPAPGPAPMTPPRTAAAPTVAPPPPPTGPAPTIGAPMGAGQFASEAQAKARCGGDTVVWVNLDSKIYHYSSYRNYGRTKSGAYMCERDTAAAGIRAARNEKRP